MTDLQRNNNGPGCRWCLHDNEQGASVLLLFSIRLMVRGRKVKRNSSPLNYCLEQTVKQVDFAADFYYC